MKHTEYARILSQGKSFYWSKWCPYNTTYTNDCFKQDFVTYNNVLLACKKTHISTIDNPPEIIYGEGLEQFVAVGVKSDNWEFVMAGPPGLLYIPEYDDETGTLSWRISSSFEEISPTKIKIQGPWKASDGIDSVILGDTNNTSANNAVASGKASQASGDCTHAFGEGAYAHNHAEIALGQYNKSNKDTIFSIGVGADEDSRTNVLEITKNEINGNAFLFDNKKRRLITDISGNNLLSLSEDDVLNLEIYIDYDPSKKQLVLKNSSDVVSYVDLSSIINIIENNRKALTWEEW